MEWISVKERLPQEGIEVLTCDISRPDYCEYRLDYVIELGNEVTWGCRIADENDKVTHWMPLPKPPNLQAPHEEDIHRPLIDICKGDLSKMGFNFTENDL